MVSDQDVQVLIDLANDLNQAGAALVNLQGNLSPTDTNNDVVSHLIGTLSEQAFTLQNHAMALALALQSKALGSVKVATAYLKGQATIISDVNTGISIFGGLTALGAAIIAGNPSGAISAASTLIGLVGAVKGSQTSAKSS